MRSIVDKHHKPHDDWARWKEDGFSFIDLCSPWEHPAISPLGYANKVSYGSLDYDSDSLMDMMLEDYWCVDMMGRSDLPEDLTDLVKKYMGLKTRQGDLEENRCDPPAEWVEEFINSYGDSWEDTLREDREFFSQLFPEHTPVEHEEIYLRSMYSIKVVEPQIREILPEILLSIIHHGYSPNINTVKKVVHEKSLKKRLSKDYMCTDIEGDLARHERELRERFSVDDEWERYIHGDHSYHLSIVVHPAENLPSYFHDELLFMNYMQNIVVVDDKHHHDTYVEECQNVVDGVLLSDTVDDELLAGIAHRIGDWWT